jgi:hydroxyacylglutathione hydrolase
MQVRIVVVTPFQQNCSVFWCQETMKGAVVDPGGDLDQIEAAIAESGAAIEKILLTHGHVDHAAAAGKLATRLGVPIEGPHVGDKFLIDALPEQAAKYGFGDADPFQPTRWLKQGDTVTVGNLRLDVKHCPGHSPGHVIYNVEAFRVAIVGDVLFQGSVGRSDLPGGDHDQLVESIRTQLWPLGDDITFVPGHGPASTFAIERQTNPFVADRLFR